MVFSTKYNDKMHRYKELDVWQKAIKLSKEMYLMTIKFPDREKYGLISQINRCAVSIPSNIAEGAGRNTSKEFNQFLGIAVGSLFELETQLIISMEIGLISKSELQSISVEIESIIKMIAGLKKSLKFN